MFKIEWVTEGDTKKLKLGNECLVKLNTQHLNEFVAYILADQYLFKQVQIANEIFTVTKMDGHVATVSYQNDKYKGNIVFKDATTFYYIFHLQSGLKIYCEPFANDSIKYKQQKSLLYVRIGIDIAELDIDRLLILLTLGKLLFRYLEQKTHSNCE